MNHPVWCEKKLYLLYKYSSGLSKGPSFFGHGFPFLSFTTIFDNYYVPEELSDLVESTEKERSTCSIATGDVFLTRTSETSEELGMSCVALRDYPNATFNGFSKRLRPFTNEIDPLFAAYYFRSPYFRSQASSMSSLITRASLNDAMINHLSIKYPKDKEFQHKIGSFFYSIDEEISKDDKRIQIISNSNELIVRHILFKELSAKKESFHIGRFQEIGSFKRGTNLKSDEMVMGTIPVIAAGLEPSGFHNEANVVGPSVTMSSSGANAGIILLHHSDIWAADCSFLANNPYLYFIYEYLRIIQPVITNLQVGSAQPHVYAKQINSLKIEIPSLNLIKRLETYLESTNAEISILEKEISLLEKQKSLLLPRIFSGKISLEGK